MTNVGRRWLICLLAAHSWCAAAAAQPPAHIEARLQELAGRAAEQQRRNDYKGAAATYREILTLRPGMLPATSNLGVMLHLDGQYQQAIDCFARVLRAQPNMLVPNLFTGTAMIRLGRAPEAVPFLKRAVSVAPSDAQAVFQLAQALAASGEFESANQYFREATRIDSANADAWFSTGTTYLKLGQVASERLARLSPVWARLLLADALVEGGEAGRAVETYQEVAKVHTAPPCVQAGLGRAYLRLGKTAESEEAFATAKTDTRCAVGPLPQAADPVAACQRQRRTSMAHLPAATLLELARCAFYTGDYAAALDATSRVVKTDARNPEAFYWRSLAAQQLAMAALSEAGRRAPQSHKIHLLLGDTYREGTRSRDALAEYKQALALEPHDLAGHWGLARTYYQSMEFDEALDELQVILKERPQEPEANYMAGRVWLAKHEPAQAEAYLRRGTLGGGPHVPHAHALLASIYVDRGETSAAIAELEQALPADQDGSYHLRICNLYKRAGDQAAASRALAAAKALRARHSEQEAGLSLASPE